jgi:uncharacterized Zn-binding protein involved in type VI secretion
MAGIQRVGDANEAGGIVQGGNGSVRINGRAVAIEGNSVTPHPCCGRKGCPPIHCSATTSGGVGSVKAGGVSIIVTGSVDTCGHARSGGSENVRIG